jgi:hypothetical protein
VLASCACVGAVPRITSFMGPRAAVSARSCQASARGAPPAPAKNGIESFGPGEPAARLAPTENANVRYRLRQADSHLAGDEHLQYSLEVA